MRYIPLVFCVLLGSVTAATAQVSVGIGIGLPGVSIGINLPAYPQLVQVPGYPVYYAPQLNSNFFFYDGMYWVYQRDSWYASSWYNGPWGMVSPEVVPLYVLRVPVRYYRTPPAYFQGWRPDAPPRWGEHWGRGWEQQRGGWDKWNRSSAPAPAPLPVYQRQYSGDRYPQGQQQQQIHNQNYRYQPRDAVVRQQYQEQERQRAPAPSQRGQQGYQGQQGGPVVPRTQPPQRGVEEVQRPVPTQAPSQTRGQTVQDQREKQQPPPPQQQGAGQREQQTPRSGQDNAPAGKGASQEPRQGQQGKGQGQGRGKDDERGQGR